MRAFNKKSKIKNSCKKRSLITKTIKNIENADILQKEFNKLNAQYVGIICEDSEGKEIGIYLHEYEFDENDKFLMEDCLGELRLYTTEDNGVFLYYNQMFGRINDYFYEFDSYPTYCDWVKFPIKNVKIFPMDNDIQTNKIAKYCFDKGRYNIIRPNKKDGIDILVYHPDIHMTIEEFSDIKRCQWLTNNGSLVYEKFIDCNGNIEYLKEL